ncbi:hypothetical protein RJD24_19425 [Bacillaceae bacterium IKA-2]|nr:hypothetical protein RJD24_19425 [Bacillaceae bacterium IKA-2]
MAKKHPVWFPGAIYYIRWHGSGDENIFFTDKDYLSFLSTLENVRYQYPFYLHSYCLTSNCIQLLLETTHVHIKDILSSLHFDYTSYFTSNYFSFKKLVQSRCRLIDSADIFLQASKFIHLTPYRTKIVTTTKDYRWSSYISFISRPPNDYVVTSRIHTFFPEPKMKHYLLFVEAEKIEANINLGSAQKEVIK